MRNVLLHAYRSSVWKLVQSRRDSVTIPTAHGLMTISTSDQFISKALYVRRQYGQDVMRTALDLLRRHDKLPRSPSAYVIDIGANVGTVCIKLVRDGAFQRALAFEPDPVNFAYLQRNIEQNDLGSRLRAFDVALSSEQGEMVLERSGENYGDHRLRTGSHPAVSRFDEERREVTRVRVERLDDVLDAEGIDPSDVGLLWMDTQGHEVHVLRGSRELLARGTSVVTEFWPYGLSRAGISEAEFVEAVQGRFTHFYDLRDARLAPAHISTVSDLFRRYSDVKFTDLLLLSL
jgi:FkbM family methyltransferase